LFDFPIFNDIEIQYEKQTNNNIISSSPSQSLSPYKVWEFLKENDIFISFEDIIETFLKFSKKIIIPSEIIKNNLPKNMDNIYGIHLRKSDKINNKGNKTHMNSIESYNKNIEKLLQDIFQIIDNEDLPSFFLCSEDFEWKKYIQNKIIEYKPEKYINFIELNYEEVSKYSGGIPVLDFFCLSKCKQIFQSVKFSTFSTTTALISNIPLINYNYNDNDNDNDNILKNWSCLLNINNQGINKEYPSKTLSFISNIETNIPYYKQNEFIIIIRGHINNSFDNDELYNFLKLVSIQYQLKIYLHTWNIKSNGISWDRLRKKDNTVVNEDSIKEYFRDLFPLIKKMFIEDDNDIILIGKTYGVICSGTLPKIGWKNMWYGIHKITQEVFNNENEKIIILNTRFDTFTNSNPINSEYLFNEISSKFKYTKFKKNYLIEIPQKLDNKKLHGIDNNVIGDKNTLIKISKHFHEKLDEIEKNYWNIITQEVIVFYENNRIFGSHFSEMFKYIERHVINVP